MYKPGENTKAKITCTVQFHQLFYQEAYEIQFCFLMREHLLM